MKEMKRILALVLCLVMLIGILPVSALAAPGNNGKGPGDKNPGKGPDKPGIVETVPETEETAAPSEETTPVTEETTAPSEETTPVTEETTAPSEETTPVTEETTAPSEETVPASSEEVGRSYDLALLDEEDEPVFYAEYTPKGTVRDAAVVFADLHIMESNGVQDNTKVSNLNGVMSALRQTGIDFSSVTSAGDAFAVDKDSGNSGKNKFTGYTSVLNDAIRGANGLYDNVAINYVWSDHDRYALRDDDTTLLDKTSRLVYGAGADGAYGTADDDNYYVYALSMADVSTQDRYGSGHLASDRGSKGFTATVDEAIDSFEAETAGLKTDRPLFIVSHLPLYDRRDDNGYAHDWYTAISKVASKMDVVFFHGHNHAHDQTGDYIYRKGSSMNICSDASGSYINEKLNFTHVNAGYLAPTSTNNYCRKGVAVAAVLYDNSIDLVTFNQNGVYSTGTEPLNLNVTREFVNKTVTHGETGIKVTAPGVSGITVTQNQAPEYDEEVYSAFVSYDIQLTNYTQGHVASVTVPVPASFDASLPVDVLDGDRVLVTTDIKDGKITFETNHFSVYSVGQRAAADPSALVWVNIPATTGAVTYERASSVQSGETYVIASGYNNSPYLLTNNSGSAGRTQVQISNNVINGAVSNGEWTFTSSGNGYTISNSTGGYLNITGSYNNRRWSFTVSTNGNSQAFSVNVANNNNNRTTISRSVTSGTRNTTAYLSHSSGFGASTSSNNYVYLFKKVVAPGTPGGDYAATGTNLTVYTNEGLSAAQVLSRAGITVYTKNENGEAVEASAGSYEIVNNVKPDTNGDYTIQVKVGSTVIKTVSVQVKTRTATSISVSNKTFTTYKGASNATVLGYMSVTYSDGITDSQVPVTLGMLSGSFDRNTPDEYPNLTLTYSGKQETGITLIVEDVPVNEKPLYPQPGAVDLDKTATGIDFQNTGIARVELSTSGLPASKGVDVVIVIDTSSSMQYDMNGTDTNSYNGENTRYQIMKRSLRQMLDQFNDANATTGVVPDIDIAVIDFNGFGSSNYINNASLDDTYRTNADNAKVYTVNGAAQSISRLTLSSSHFMHNTDIDPDTIANKFTGGASGTNYDGALQNAYDLLAAKKAANGQNAREQFVIFMSDGASFRYNGFMTGNSDRRDWFDLWLTGEWDDADALYAAIMDPTNEKYNASYHDAAANLAYLYNGNGDTHPHRMAEAIKGIPGQSYDVVLADRSTVAGSDTPYLHQREGLGAKIYSIGFCMQDDTVNNYTVKKETLIEVIKTLSSGEGYYVENATSENDLKDAFDKIVSDIAMAATNAYFVDKMGDSYNLQMNPTVQSEANPGTGGATVNTDIVISSQPVYTQSTAPNSNDIGKPNTTEAATEIERVKFIYSGNTLSKVVTTSGGYTLPNGTAVVAATLDAQGNVTNATAATNILYENVICAKNFYYNANATAYTIEGTGFLTNSGDSTSNARKIVLDGETFRWNIGTINEKRYTMAYTVILDGAMDGEVSSGSYATNEYATLYYKNYLDHDVNQSIDSPTVPWDGAQVSYAFYLVNDLGQPLYENGTVAPNFLVAHKLTKETFYEMVKLNSTEVVLSAVGQNILPEGYELFAPDANYSVHVASGGGYHSGWTISGDPQKTTYIMGYGGEKDYTNVQNVSAANSEEYANWKYTETVVYFAVKWNIGTVPDVVVVDYGLPVDIHVLQNDMLGGVGTLSGVKNQLAASGHTATPQFSTSDTLTHGKVAVNENAVRYTPTTMVWGSATQESYDRFAYEARYIGADGVQYYQGDVTVVPATTVYYEDSYTDSDSNNITYKVYDLNGTITANAWSQEGSTIDGVQAEDRPGKFSLNDANNVYGYDGAYTQTAKFSMGSAKYVEVNANNYATAEFTFRGTGFDVISMTDTETGVLFVQVYDMDNNLVVSEMVDTYYGYAYGEYEQNGETKEGWYPVQDNAQNALYQVPVIKISGLGYNQYNVKLTASYNKYFDHVDGSAAYRFYLDAIRIYNPAGTGSDLIYDKNNNEEYDSGDTSIFDVYAQDNEGWPVYQELRNKILSVNDFNALTAGDQTSGAIFIDHQGKDYPIEDYKSYGPNNELYLAGGQSVAFEMDLSGYIGEITNAQDQTVPASLVADVQIGAKNAEQGTGSYTVTTMTRVGAQTTMSRAREFSTATDMYYSMKSLLDLGTEMNPGDDTAKQANDSKTIVVIENTGEKVISITNIKITFIQEIPQPMDVVPFRMSREIGNAAVMMLRSAAPAEPEETLPEETLPEDETTLPEDVTEGTTEPEGTDPEETEPEEETKPNNPDKEAEKLEKELQKALEKAAKAAEKVAKELQKAAEKAAKEAAKALSKLFKNWF